MFKNINGNHLIGLKSRLIIAIAVNPLETELKPGFILSARYNVMFVVICTSKLSHLFVYMWHIFFAKVGWANRCFSSKIGSGYKMDILNRNNLFYGG